MIDLKLLRNKTEEVQAALATRGASGSLQPLLDADSGRRAFIHNLEMLRAEQNKASPLIAQKKRLGEDASDLLGKMKLLSDEISLLEVRVKLADALIDDLLLNIPNLPDPRVPVGRDESENRLEREWGVPGAFGFTPRDHVDLGEALGILDFEGGARLAGSRFCVLRGAGAQLERAVLNFMLDTHTRGHGYTELQTPLIVNSASMQATGQLPKFAEDLFKVEGTDYWLIPTAEVPVTNLHRDEIIAGDRLPLSYTAGTPCWRSEAGSYGKDTRGMIRQHQFNKVELVKFCTPETSDEEHEKLTAHAEAILQKLELPYRVMTLCTGDMGFAARKTYDLEVWLPGQNAYREISSCSNFGDFQARRGNIRFKRDKKPEFIHTLNGSGLAVGRTVVAILENYQDEDGRIRVPGALRSYMGGAEYIG